MYILQPDCNYISGQAASAGDDDIGGGGEFLCVPDHPQWLNHSSGFQRLTARLHGAVYLPNNLLEATDNVRLGNKAIPCAACYVESRGHAMMLPSRLTCPVTWTLEYHGYLMAASKSNHRSSYVCMDAMATAKNSASHSRHSDSKATLDHVEATCGSLDCPNYVSGREITCAVCTN